MINFEILYKRLYHGDGFDIFGILLRFFPLLCFICIRINLSVPFCLNIFSTPSLWKDIVKIQINYIIDINNLSIIIFYHVIWIRIKVP